MSQEPTEEQLLGSRIRNFREAAGLRQVDLAERIGVDTAAVSRIEAGGRRVSSTELNRIGASLGVSVLALLDDDHPLREVAMAARTVQDTNALQTSAFGRAQALLELYAVVSRHLPPQPTIQQIPVINTNDCDASGEILAAWARGIMGYPVTGEAVTLSALAEKIEQAFGIDILAEPDRDGIDGLTTTMPGVALIQVNTARTRRRCTFTLAHELGHALMAHGGTSVSADEDEGAGAHEFRARTPAERWCNAFAIALLVPEDSVFNRVRNADDLDGILNLYADSGASWQAVVYRLHNLHYLDAHQRDVLLGQPPTHWANTPNVASETRSKLHGVDISASDEYRPPRRLSSATYEAFLSGTISARPYAGLMRVSVDRVLNMVGSTAEP